MNILFETKIQISEAVLDDIFSIPHLTRLVTIAPLLKLLFLQTFYSCHLLVLRLKRVYQDAWKPGSFPGILSRS